MPLTLGQNLNSLRTLRMLNGHAAGQSRAFERLSTGSRINRASDDAAGLAVSIGLQNTGRLTARALLNINDGMSALNVAEGGVRQLSSLTERLMELAQQASNGSFSTNQRLSLQRESDQLVAEFNRIVGDLSFNGSRVLDGSQRDLDLQIGVSLNGGLSAGIGNGLTRRQWDETYGNVTSLGSSGGGFEMISGDFNGDGRMDFASPSSSSGLAVIRLQDGFGSYSQSFVPTSLTGLLTYGTAADVNNDGHLDLVFSSQTASGGVSVLLNNGSGTFSQSHFENFGGFARNVKVADMNGDGQMDIISARGSSGLRILYGNGNGTFQASVAFAIAGNPGGLDVGDLDNDGDTDVIIANNSGGFETYLNDGQGNLSLGRMFSSGNPTEVFLADFNRDGYLDAYGGNSSLFLGSASGQFTLRSGAGLSGTMYGARATDINGDGILDLHAQGGGVANGVEYRLGNGDGTFRSISTLLASTAVRSSLFTDASGDGVAELITVNTAGTFGIAAPGTRNVTTMAYQSLARIGDARSTLDNLTIARSRIQKELSNLGASQSRLQSVLRVTQAQSGAFAEALGRITDADIAEESAQVIRTKILTETSQALLAQTKLDAGLVLMLLKNGPVR